MQQSTNINTNTNTQEHIATLLGSNRVVLFMKGERAAPQCGFSATVVQILDELLPNYSTVNVLSDPELRAGIKQFSQWPTIPQLYIDNTFIGGCDIVREMYATGALHSKLGVAVEQVAPPHINITDAAVAAVRQAIRDSDENDNSADSANSEAEGEGTGATASASAAAAQAPSLRLQINAQFEHALSFGELQPGDVSVQANGLGVLLDRASAKRAQGLTIDYVESADGAGFRIDNPNAPVLVHDMSVQELAQRINAGEQLCLFDVRTAEEIAIASIAAARPLDTAARAQIDTFNKDTPLIFLCHHGRRSHKAAAEYINKGFQQVYSVVGGIEAWSCEIDNSVPRY